MDGDLISWATYGPHSIQENPKIGDTQGNLRPGSPCIDAGTDMGLPFNGEAPDMGAREFGLVDAWKRRYIFKEWKKLKIPINPESGTAKKE